MPDRADSPSPDTRHRMVPGVVLAVAVVPLFAIALASTSAGDSRWIHRALFVMTLAVEVAAWSVAWGARRVYAGGDAGRRTWNLVVAFLGFRLLAELRLTTFYLDIVPGFVRASSDLTFFYAVVLRYLYTAGDLLFVAALLSSLRAFVRAGFALGLRRADAVVVLILLSLPLLVFAYRDRLGTFIDVHDPHIVTYRLVAVSVGSVIASLSWVVLRVMLSMGGGLLARIWGAIATAGIARAASFAMLAALAPMSARAADLAEQSMLWVFACAWLGAAIMQRRAGSYLGRA